MPVLMTAGRRQLKLGEAFWTPREGRTAVGFQPIHSRRGFSAAPAFLLLAAGLTVPARGQDSTPSAVIPREPPRADLITFGPLDELGRPQSPAPPRAVLPGRTVQVINLDTSHQAFVDGDAVVSDGSFETTIFAPPGSNIMVRHGRRGWWRGLGLEGSRCIWVEGGEGRR